MARTKAVEWTRKNTETKAESGKLEEIRFECRREVAWRPEGQASHISLTDPMSSVSSATAVLE